MAVIVTKLEDGGLDGKAVDPFDEAPPIGAAAKLAVGHDLEARLFLQPDRVADAIGLYPFEFVVADLPVCMLLERLAKGMRAKQTADMIGAERQALMQAHGRFLRFRMACNSIDL